jgi:hypothetical protein
LKPKISPSEDSSTAVASSGFGTPTTIKEGQSQFGFAPKGMRAEKARVEANRCNPSRDEPSILPGRHAAVVITTATEQKFARFLPATLM